MFGNHENREIAKGTPTHGWDVYLLYLDATDLVRLFRALGRSFHDLLQRSLGVLGWFCLRFDVY